MGKDLRGRKMSSGHLLCADRSETEKKWTVRPNTVRNDTERYERNIDSVIGKLILSKVKSDIGKPTQKKEALTLEQQKKFVRGIEGNTYEYQYKFLLQTGLRTGELVGLKWSDIDFDNRTLTISRSMEYRHSIGEWRVGEPKSKSGYRSIYSNIPILGSQ